jgi:hypothetical protein
MAELLLIARCLLAAVFAIAALAKLADLASFRATLGEFGAAPAAARIGAVAVPVAELAIAALLVPAATAVAAAIAALVLLAGFCTAIGRVLRRDEAPDCGCFGSKPSPVSRSTLARNVGLGGVAMLVAAAGPGAAFTAPPVAVLVGAAFVAQGWFAWQLFRQHGRLLERVAALEQRTDHARDGHQGLAVVHRHRAGRLDQRLRNLED